MKNSYHIKRVFNLSQDEFKKVLNTNSSRDYLLIQNISNENISIHYENNDTEDGIIIKPFASIEFGSLPVNNIYIKNLSNYNHAKIVIITDDKE